MSAESLTTGQWWIVAVAASAALLAAVHFCFRNRRATVYSLIAPALGAVAVLGFRGAHDHSEVEALVIFSVSLLSLALLIVAMRPDMEKIRARALTGETYEVPKWKINLYGVLVVAFAVVVVFLLL
ncbi:hypothetical protein [Streptomyces sp. NPDC020330]|uniref:hypothetical protein n=1 Tax=unclassified Streptomyces TaxID=2593676 RepID=UPI0037B08E74